MQVVEDFAKLDATSNNKNNNNNNNKKKKKKKKSSKKKKGNNNNQRHKVKGNFVLQAAPGCHIIHDNKPPNWIVGIDTFAPEDFGLTVDNEDQMPDISIDPESGLLTCINKHNNNIRTFYISVSCNLYNVNMEAMDKGEARDTKGNLFECSTFVIVLEPRKLIDVCYLEPLTMSITNNTNDKDDNNNNVNNNNNNNQYNLYSDIQDISLFQYTSPLITNLYSNGKQVLNTIKEKEKYCNYIFPFKLNLLTDMNDTNDNNTVSSTKMVMNDSNNNNNNNTTAISAMNTKPILCSQGFCGCFTHFFKATLHAIDLECPVDTPIYAVSDGIVVDIKQDNIVGGIHASNLYKWNSIMLKLDDGQYVEYVHIQANSVLVKLGEKVKRGQHICNSGDVGFCPRPHLHIQMHDTDRKDAPTIPFGFKKYSETNDETKDGNAKNSGNDDDDEIYFIPEAGKYYTENGLYCLK